MFSADWLALREPADAAARSASLAGSSMDGRPRAEPIRVLDLAAGTGANARYLVDRLPREQDWLLVDLDASLLAQVPERMARRMSAPGRVVSTDEHGVRVTGAGRPPIRLTTRRVDLAALDDPALFTNRDLVTASALLDLVSETWLRVLAARCRKAGAAALFALTYDGGMRCTPEDPDDARIRDLVNRHQRTDKGFGLALGPDAVVAAEHCFAAEGYQVRRERSDWMLAPAMTAIQMQLVDGWAQAAREIAHDDVSSIEDWRRRRLAFIDRGVSAIVVGHEDIAVSQVFPGQ